MRASSFLLREVNARWPFGHDVDFTRSRSGPLIVTTSDCQRPRYAPGSVSNQT